MSVDKSPPLEADVFHAPTESIVIPEIDEETSEKREGLPSAYRKEVIAHYKSKNLAVERYISEGKLDESYRLPELNDFMDRIEALAPTFKYIAKTGQPSFELFPRGLTEIGWYKLLNGHGIDGQRVCHGTSRFFNSQRIELTSTEPKVDINLWGLVVIDTQERPAISGISPDGTKAIRRVNINDAITALKALPGVAELNNTRLIVEQASPSGDAYLGTHLSRLERGIEKPLDIFTSTIVKGEVVDGGVRKAIVAGFDWTALTVTFMYPVAPDSAHINRVVRMSREM